MACSTGVYLCGSSRIYLLPGYKHCFDNWLFSGLFSRLSLYGQIFPRSGVCFSVSVTEFRVSRDL